uniref:RNA-directed DNA polymerase n=1 Tax=Drosophila ananassae TaxID=7217 RepID=A0A175EU06_DROAN|nr:TPA_exp: gag-pol protein [Drosophila ananassae]
MGDTAIKPFLCEAMDKAILRNEWEKWLRSFTIYLEAEGISDTRQKRSKILLLGGVQLQSVAYSLPGALIDPDDKGEIDIYAVLVERLGKYFSPKQNSTFERHLFRSLTPSENGSFSDFVLQLRQQMSKCSFGSCKKEIEDICLKDKIIDAWAPLELKKKFLGKEHSLDEVIEACQVEEQIDKASKAMTSRPDVGPICKISNQKPGRRECPRCGKFGHTYNDPACPARKASCNKCSKIGHFAKMCRTIIKERFSKFQRSSLKRPNSYIRCVGEEAASPKQRKEESPCFKISSDEGEEHIKCHVGGRNIRLIIDSGSKFNLLSHADWSRLKREKATFFNERFKSEEQFRGYASDKLLQVICIFEAPISVEPGAEIFATFYVIENGRQSLLGRDTAVELKVLRLGRNINQIKEIVPFPKWKGIEVKLSIDDTVRPVQQPLRRIPVALEDRVMEKLNEALSRDIIEPVTAPSSWISPIVLAFKENGDIRVCVDMRQANRAILRENYPLPTFDSFMTRLKKAKFFARLDLKDAYHQLALDKASREITTFITPEGLFRYKRLMFGVNSAPEIFQRLLEQMLSKVPNALNFIDDIIIFGATKSETDNTVKQVCQIFQENNVLLNKDKCVWNTDKLKFLGHILSAKGIEVDPEKIDTIRSFRAPKNKEKTRSFLGLVTYVGKFIPDLAHHTDTLRKLLKTENKFTWGEAERMAFSNLKDQLAEVPRLAYFNPKHRTRVIADASPVALGHVLLQFSDKGDPLIISFASKALSEVETRYSQTEKESLALVWAVEKFYYYLAGLHFELVTDHKPLEAIFKPTSKPPARIERWLLRLQSYKFTVIYKAGKENISDALSRLCQLSTAKEMDPKTEYSILRLVQSSVPKCLTISNMVEFSLRDEEIIDAISCLQNNSWKPEASTNFYPFRNELSSIGSLLLRGNRIVVPTPLREQTLELAHEGHPGETAMKRRLRSKVWWPQMDRAVEKFVKACRDCCLVSQAPRPPPMDRHLFPTGPWIWVASDLLGPLPNGEYILVFIDYFSNGKNYKEEIQSFVLMYNVTPHGTTGVAPTKLMFNRVIRDKIPGIEEIEEQYLDSAEMDRDLVEKHKGKQATDKRRGARESDIKVGDKVFQKNVVFPNKLTPTFDNTEYTVVEKHRNIVEIERDGRKLTRNVGHLKKVPEMAARPKPPQTPEGGASPITFPADAASQDLNLTSRIRRPDQAPQPPLKLKLVNKGGMWEPALEENQRDPGSDAGPAEKERNDQQGGTRE